MKKALMSVMALSAILIALFVAMPLAPAADKLNPILEIPFPGVMLVYTEQEIGVRVWAPEWGKGKETDVRTVTFLPSLEAGHVWMRDSLDPESTEGVPEFSEAEIDISTRKIVHPPDLNYYSQFLIPTDIRVNDVIYVGIPEFSGTSPGLPVTVVGTQIISVMGKRVYAWVLEIRHTNTYQYQYQYTYTYLYCKSSGILLSAQGAWFNEDGTPTYSWTILLTDTNAQIR